MSTIVDMLYHEFCRARLAEMRKQFLIPAIDEILPVRSEDSDSSGPHDHGWATKEPPTIG
jgi:hypothetical protein